jgi:hypothetical protein
LGSKAGRDAHEGHKEATRCKTRQPSTPSRRSKKAPDKTLITHIDEGLDFLGWHIQRHRERGTSQHYVYVYPSKKAVLAVKRKIKTLRRTVEPNQPLDILLRRLNATLRGMVRLFPGRGVFRGLCLPESLRVADGLALVATKTPQIDLETTGRSNGGAVGGLPARNGS